jgi:hypothetical protein
MQNRNTPGQWLRAAGVHSGKGDGSQVIQQAELARRAFAGLSWGFHASTPFVNQNYPEKMGAEPGLGTKAGHARSVT